jgi:formate dehydrogenase major subunit
MCGQWGGRAPGLHPLRGQNNVQGASDAGLIPMVLPDYQGDRRGVRAPFPRSSGAAGSEREGPDGGRDHGRGPRGEIKGMYILGENPAMSDPDVEHARDALAKLDHLVVQDIFLTETAMYADVILPASAFAEKIGHRDQHQPAGADGPQGVRRRARRARTGRSPTDLAAAWGWTGPMTARRTCSPR